MRSFSSLLLIAFAFITVISISNSEPIDEPHWSRYFGPNGGEITALRVDQNDDVFAAEWGGDVLFSEDGAESWTVRSSGLESSFVTDFELAPNGGIYAATMDNGVFYSANAGLVWTSKSEGLDNLAVKDLAIGPNGEIAAATYGGGVYISDDAGNSWTAINDKLWFRDVNCVVFAPDGEIIAGTNGDGIYVSDENRTTWKSGNAGLNANVITDLVVNEIEEIYAATYGNSIRFSVNNGSTWSAQNMRDRQPINASCLVSISWNKMVAGTFDKGTYFFDYDLEKWNRGDIRDVGINAMDVASDGTVYCAAVKSGVYKSDNHGEDWTQLSLRVDHGLKILGSFNKGVIFATDKNLACFRTHDRGKTWLPTNVDGKIVFTIEQDSLGRFYAGTDDGVYRSLDTGTTWEQFGMNDSMVTAIAVDDLGNIYCGAGPFFSGDTITGNWRKRNLPAEEVFIEQILAGRDGYVFTFTSSEGGIFRTDDRGQSWDRFLAGQILTIMPSRLAIDSQNRIYLSHFAGMYKTDNSGDSWQVLNYGRDDQSRNLAVTPTDQLYMAFAWDNGTMHTSDRGTTWDTTQSGIYIYNPESMKSGPDGFVYYSTNSIYQLIDSASLGVPDITSPVDGSGREEINPTFDWEEAENADLYHIQVAYDFGFENIVEEVTMSETEYTMLRTLDYNKQHFFRVRSKLNASYSPWNSIQFSTKLIAPELAYPADSSEGFELTLDLGWKAVEGALRYNVKVASDPEFANIVYEIEDVEDTTAQVTVDELHTRYYWKVQAENNFSESDWSETWNFVTKLLRPNLRLPEDESIGHPTEIRFEWTVSDGASKYTLQISKDPDFQTFIFDGLTQTTQYMDFDLLQYFTKYYWRLRAENEKDNKSDWSDVWEFMTGIPAPTLEKPSNDSLNLPVQIKFEWSGFNQTQAYRLQVAKDEGFNDIIFDNETITDEEKIVDISDRFTQIYWRVASKIDEFVSPWSEVRTLKTALAAPTLQSPEQDAKDQALTITVRWSPVLGAEGYYYEVASDPQFNSVVASDEVGNQEYRQISGLAYKTNYHWRVKALWESGESPWSEVWNFTTLRDPDGVYERFVETAGLKAYPNPFGSSIKIEFELSQASRVRLEITDAFGSVIAVLTDEALPAGREIYEWEPGSISAGVYYYKLTIDGETALGKMVYVK